MADLNRVFLMGSLTFDPELRRTPNGTAVTELRMVTTRSWPGRDGERREEKLFIDITVWERQAENCCQYLKKGSQIHVEGSLRMDTWEDKATGEKRSKIRVHADRVQFLDARRGDGASGADDDYAASSSAPAREPTSARRGSAAAMRGNGGPAEPRGANGAGRPASQPATGASDAHSGGESDEGEGEDIPF
jgi:single-strand DNA-binding protein